MADDDKDPKPAAKDDAPADSPPAKPDAPVLKKDAGDAIVAKQDKAAPVTATAKTAAKKPAPPVDEDEDDDDDDDDDEYEDEDEDEPPPKAVKRAPIAKAKAAPKGKATPKGKVAARVARPVRRLRVGHYLPWAFGGMALVGTYVAWYPEHSYAVPAVLGIAISVWAYIGIGSVNEIKA